MHCLLQCYHIDFLGPEHTHKLRMLSKIEEEEGFGVFLFAFLIHVFSTLDLFLSIRVSGEG